MAELRTYYKKRDFKKTAEPKGEVGESGDTLRYVIQKHDATRLHYDLRLEMEGVYRSWAVPKGPSLDPADKRLAMETEDHPIAYGTFEGTIPQGEYGGGTVLLWDVGEFIPEGDPVAGYHKGHIKFRLEGEKLHGAFHLVKTRGGRNGKRQDERAWILFKSKDEHARKGGTVDTLEEASVKTGRKLAEIADVASMPSVIEPQLCRLVEEPPKGDAWLHEPKIDGYRVMMRKEGRDVRLFTRGGLDWTDRFPEVRDAVADLPVHSVILDGEVAVLDGESGGVRFEALQRALSDGGSTAGMVCFVFDCLFLEGHDIRSQPLIARKEVMFALLAEQSKANADVLLAVPHDEGHGDKAFTKAQKQGLEGIVSKLRDAPYTSGRGEAWLKVKATQREELVVIGWSESDTGPKRIGSLLLASRDENGELTFAGKVGTGYTSKDKSDLYKLLSPLEVDASVIQPRPSVTGVGKVHWTEPDIVVEVAFGDVTRDGILRHASYQGLRHDKRAKDVTERGVTQKEPNARARKSAKSEAKSEAKSAAKPAKSAAKPAKSVATPEKRAAKPVKRASKTAKSASKTAKSAPRDKKRGAAKSAKGGAKSAKSGGIDLAVAADVAGYDPKELDVEGAGEAHGAESAASDVENGIVRGIKITSPDRVVYPETGVTKLMLARYIDAVAPLMLPYVVRRPLAVVRCPTGSTGQCFFQKHVGQGMTKAISSIKVPEGSGTGDTEKAGIAVDDEAGLVALVQMGVLEIHPWGCQPDDPEAPDRIIFDLDPATDVPWERVCDAAREVKRRLHEDGLESFVKTTGGKGLHVEVPLDGSASWDEVKTYAGSIAEAMTRADPAHYTDTMSKAKRVGKIFVDYFRNGRGSTAIAPYSMRARPGATVSAPVAWNEIDELDPSEITVLTLHERLAVKDPWAKYFKLSQTLPKSSTTSSTTSTARSATSSTSPGSRGKRSATSTATSRASQRRPAARHSRSAPSSR